MAHAQDYLPDNSILRKLVYIQSFSPLSYVSIIEWCVGPGLPTKRSYVSNVSSGVINGEEYLAYGSGKMAILRPVKNLDNAEVIFVNHPSNVTAVTISPDGTWVASGDEGGSVLIWESTGKRDVKHTYNIGTGITDIRFSKDGKKFVAGGDGRWDYVKAYPVGKTNAIGKIDRITKRVLSMDWSPTEDIVVTADENLEVNVFKGPIFKHATRIQKHTRYPNVVRFAPNGETFATVGSDSKINLYSKEGEFLRSFSEEKDVSHTASIYGLSWSADSTQVATAGADKTVKVWNVADGTLVQQWKVEGHPRDLDNHQVGLHWLKSGPIVSVSMSGELNVYTVGNENRVRVVQSPSAVGNIVGFDVDVAGGFAYTASSEGRVSAIELKTGALEWFAIDGSAPVQVENLALSSDKKTLYVTTADKSLRACDVSKRVISPPTVVFDDFVSLVRTARTTPGLLVVYLKKTSAIALVRDNKIVATQRVPGCVSITFSPDDTQVAIATGTDQGVMVYTIADGFSHDFTYTEQSAAPAVAVTWGSKLGVTTAEKNLISIYKGGRTSLSPGWVFQNSNVSALRYSPNEQVLMSAAMDKSVVLLRDFDKFRPAGKPFDNLHFTGISFAEWLDDYTIITVAIDNSIKKWSFSK